ncbi:MAG: hypothetical protein CR217_06855 [Beijerinckiaceae bacterium]|nr:MAG: hypothetical protein CR217_06855 [Beijerinckiaceae bacterium]
MASDKSAKTLRTAGAERRSPRNQNVAGNPTPGGAIPSWDVTLNYVPIAYPAETPAIIQMKPGEREFWRVANASADTILDLQVVYVGVAQPLHVVAFDGVPTGSQDGTRRGKMSATVKNAVFQTLNINTGPDGDNDPQRPLAVIQATPDAPSLQLAREPPGQPGLQRFEGLAQAAPRGHRSLYFSEVIRPEQSAGDHH